MKRYNSIDKLETDWLTTKDLFRVLESYNLPHDLQSVVRWEKMGKIPKASRVLFREVLWRVYKKDGSDFKEILHILLNQ